MENCLKGKSFIFDNTGRAKAAFWLYTQEHPEMLNFWNKVGVTFYTEVTSMEDELQCEVFDLEGKEIYVDDSTGIQKNLGTKVSGTISARELMFLKMFNGVDVSEINRET